MGRGAAAEELGKTWKALFGYLEGSLWFLLGLVVSLSDVAHLVSASSRERPESSSLSGGLVGVQPASVR